MIQHLRQQEEVLLFGNLLSVAEQDKQATLAFLQSEYEQEKLNYPYQAPAFDAESAWWAAQIVYVTAQILLYRQHEETELPRLLPDFPLAPIPSRIISVDLTLRFLPDMLLQARHLSPEDALIPLLEAQLMQWHYAGISCHMPPEKLDFSQISINDCLHQLYTNRIIRYKNVQLASHPVFLPRVLASLGNYVSDFWSEIALVQHQALPEEN